MHAADVVSVVQERSPDTDLQEVMCDDPKIALGEKHKHLENSFEVRAGSRLVATGQHRADGIALQS